MAKNEKLNEEAAMNLNLSEADLLMAKDVVTDAEYVEPSRSNVKAETEGGQPSGKEERKRLQKYVDLGDVF